MSHISTSADQLIGKTPLLELTHIEKKFDLKAKILAKLEYFNPAGSVKDRVARAMIDDAEADYILPNVTEAALLAGLPYPEQAGSASEQIDCAYAERLAAGAAAHAEQTVLLTGVSFEPGKTGVFLWRDGKSCYYAHEKSPCGGYGTGDVFASAFTGTLLNGRTAERAARLAADYTARCAARTAQDPAHWYGLEFEPELPWLIRRLEDRE